MGAFLAKPKTEKNTDKGEGNGIRYGLCSMQGWRVDMEDAHTTVVSLSPELKNWSFFAVFDGHAGKIAAEICSSELVKEIQNQFMTEEGLKDTEDYNIDAVKETVRKSFLKMDQALRQKLKDQGDRSGTTCTALLITPKHYFFINCGDSRGMLTSTGNVKFATKDHKPTNDEERDRIVRAGGLVMTQRINGSLAVSRALGDFDYKTDETREATEQLVSPEPDVTVIDRNVGSDQFICLACDGIFDVFSNEDLSNFITSRLEIKQEYDLITAEIVDTSLHKGSRDNMSVILIALESCVKINEQAQKNESKLEELLTQHTKKLVEEATKADTEHNININDILQNLDAVEEIRALLPLGGGIHSKHSFVEPLLFKFCPKMSDENGDE